MTSVGRKQSFEHVGNLELAVQEGRTGTNNHSHAVAPDGGLVNNEGAWVPVGVPLLQREVDDYSSFLRANDTRGKDEKIVSQDDYSGERLPCHREASGRCRASWDS
jgi:hypothetical protein